ncbi:MAG TPA: hypothetical protein ENF17_06725 [Candidatus Aminicenantes bacterium]|nr:hypothetical protein [Candidatus Aminicenantes bacterium]
MMKRLVGAVGLLGFLTIVFDLSSHATNHGGWWLRIPGFFILFGLVGCLFLIIGAKALGQAGLLKDEDYYDRH